MLRLIGLETRLLARDVVAALGVVVLVIAVGLAVANGRALLAGQQAGRAQAAAEAREAETGMAEKLAGNIDPADAVYLPFRLKLPVVAPLPPLADASAGRAGYDSYAATASIRSRADTLFKRTSMANPELLARGGLDLGFVAIVVAPLLLIALGHGLFTADRDSGAARLVLAQASGPGRLLLARSVPRLALVALPLLLGLGWLLAAGPDVPGRMAAALGWSAIVALYLALWWAIILLANSYRITAETAALVLVSAWAMLTLVVPVLITAVAQIAYPPPSRFEQIAAARAAEIAATSAWDNSHKQAPEGDVAGAFADLARSLAINARIESAVAPINLQFDERLAQQQRVIGTLSLLSPPRIAADALTASAGTDSDAALAFRRSTAAYLKAFKAPITALSAKRRTLSAADYAALPRYAPPPPPPVPLPVMLYLATATLLVGLLAFKRFARLKLD